MYPHETSVEKTRAAAESGDPKAALHLGWRYYIGKGVARDKTEAWKWYGRAASQGIRDAAEIRGILETVAQRDSELAMLREAIPSPHRTFRVWLLITCGVLTSIASITVVFQVLNGQSDARERGTVDDEQIIGTRAASPSPGNPEKQGTLTQDEVRPEDSTRTPATGRAVDGIPAKHESAASTMAVQPKTQPKQAPGPKSSSRPRIDFNDWAERARRWLEDGNDLYSPGGGT